MVGCTPWCSRHSLSICLSDSTLASDYFGIVPAFSFRFDMIESCCWLIFPSPTSIMDGCCFCAERSISSFPHPFDYTIRFLLDCLWVIFLAPPMTCGMLFLLFSSSLGCWEIFLETILGLNLAVLMPFAPHLGDMDWCECRLDWRISWFSIDSRLVVPCGLLEDEFIALLWGLELLSGLPCLFYR